MVGIKLFILLFDETYLILKVKMKNQIKLSKVVLLVLLITASGCVQSQILAFKSHGKINYPITADETAMLDSIQHKTFLFF